VDQGKVVSRGEGSGEDVDDTLLSDTLRYINLTKVTTGPVAFLWTDAPVYMCE
jgi:hypothetical protein